MSFTSPKPDGSPALGKRRTVVVSSPFPALAKSDRTKGWSGSANKGMNRHQTLLTIAVPTAGNSAESLFTEPAISIRHHVCKPWWIPVTLLAEFSGMGWALPLVAQGLHYLKSNK